MSLVVAPRLHEICGTEFLGSHTMDYPPLRGEAGDQCLWVRIQMTIAIS